MKENKYYQKVLLISVLLPVNFHGKAEGMGRRQVNYRVFENFLYSSRRYGERNWS